MVHTDTPKLYNELRDQKTKDFEIIKKAINEFDGSFICEDHWRQQLKGRTKPGWPQPTR
jgi:hypothetical protein